MIGKLQSELRCQDMLPAGIDFIVSLLWVDFSVAYCGMLEGHGRLRSIFVEVVQKQVIGISVQGAYDPKDGGEADCFEKLADICLMVLV